MKRFLVVAVALVVGACGGGDDGSSASAQTVDIEMRDIAYTPASIEVTAGEKVTLRFRNVGSVDHDAFIGDADAQRDHEKSMRSGDDSHHHGGDSNAVTVKPGETETLSYTFDSDDDGLIIGCHEPGHYAQGMKIVVKVVS